MTLNGYYFAATGVSDYAFYHGDRDVLHLLHDGLPDAPMRLRASSGEEYTIVSSADQQGVKPAPGASFAFMDRGGEEAGWLYLLSADHFAVAIPGTALNGRIIHDRARRSACYTGFDDELVVRLEYGFERMLSREQFGEWFPRRYVADVLKPVDETLLAMALSAPFLGFERLEVR